MTNPPYSLHDLRLAYALSRGTKLAPGVVKEILLRADSIPATLSEARDFVNAALPMFGEEAANHWKDFDHVLERHKRQQIYMLGIRDPRYPSSLRAIFDPPPVLYVKGNIELFQSLPGAAVVGTREASQNGLRIAYRIAAWLSESGFTIVSGLALGIDAAAHEGALSVNSPNIAVLAHGVETISPSRNVGLADRVMGAGGLLVSEHPINTIPRKNYFVERNRIQIGLSAGSVIIEGKFKSGTMTQAAFCSREKRPLFAVVATGDNKSLGLVSEGPMSLVKQKKAYPISGRGDYVLVQARLQESRDRLRKLHGNAKDLMA